MQPDDQGQPVVPASDGGAPVGGPMPGQTPPAPAPMPVGGAEEPGAPTEGGSEEPAGEEAPNAPAADPMQPAA